MILPLKRYADFEGRSRRQEYWAFWCFRTVIYVLVWSLVAGVFIATGSLDEQTQFEDVPAAAWSSLLLPVIAWGYFLVPSIAVQVRRYHDQNVTGWLGLLNIPYYIPYLGTLVGVAILIFMLLPGTKGANTYGPDPKGDPDPLWRPQEAQDAIPSVARIDYGQPRGGAGIDIR